MKKSTRATTTLQNATQNIFPVMNPEIRKKVNPKNKIQRSILNTYYQHQRDPKRTQAALPRHAKSAIHTPISVCYLSSRLEKSLKGIGKTSPCTSPEVNRSDKKHTKERTTQCQTALKYQDPFVSILNELISQAITKSLKH